MEAAASAAVVVLAVHGEQMKHAKDFLTSEEQAELRDAIKEAEQCTSGEIVPVIAITSGRYDRAEDILGLLAGSLLLSIVWGIFQGVNALPAEWGPDYQLRINLPLTIGLFLFGFAGGALAATLHPPLCKIFIRKREINEEVHRRAAEAFYRFGIANTIGKTGVLIYISLFERRVVVLGDSVVAEKVSQDEWKNICADISEGIKSGKAFSGIKKAIIDCGSLLKNHLPAPESDLNQLKDEIHFIE